jgi:hypothetical protein
MLTYNDYKILDEDVYLEKLEKIIRWDYFPELNRIINLKRPLEEIE